jgi:hypothetical protein
MRFKIRSILLVTLLTALLFAPLAKPSQYWAMFLPALAAVATTLITAKASARPELLFWKAMPAGVFAYLFCVQFIGYFIGIDLYRGRNFWNEELGLPLFKLLHGESAFVTNRQGLVDHDLMSFYVWVHVVAAVVLSSVVALIAHIAANLKKHSPKPLDVA